MTRKYKYKVVRGEKSCIVNPASKFSLVYKKDTNVYAPDKTLGIMVFKTKDDAKQFVDRISNYQGIEFNIKKVIPIGRGKTPRKISRKLSADSLRQFYKYKDRDLTPATSANLFTIPPAGTICYPGVFVCD